MAIPAANSTSVKDLLLIADTAREDEIQQAYDRAFDWLVRRADFFAEREYISASAGTSTYTATTGRRYRVLAILHNGVTLMKTTEDTIDRLRHTWQTEANGTPEFWWPDKIPVSVGAWLPEQWHVLPPPSVDATGSAGFTTLLAAIPQNTATLPLWLNPIIEIKTAAEFLQHNAEERRTQEDTPVIQFFNDLGDVWLSMLKTKMP